MLRLVRIDGGHVSIVLPYRTRSHQYVHTWDLRPPGLLGTLGAQGWGTLSCASGPGREMEEWAVSSLCFTPQGPGEAPEPLQLLCVGVPGREGGHRGSWGRPLRQAGPQWILLEHGRLVDIPHLHADSGLIPLRPGRSRLQGDLVLHLHSEVVLVTTLIVQGLWGGSRAGSLLRTPGPSWSGTRRQVRPGERLPVVLLPQTCPQSPRSPSPFQPWKKKTYAGQKKAQK